MFSLPTQIVAGFPQDHAWVDVLSVNKLQQRTLHDRSLPAPRTPGTTRLDFNFHPSPERRGEPNRAGGRTFA